MDSVDGASGLDVVGNLAHLVSGSGLQIVEVLLSAPSVAAPALQLRKSSQQLELKWPASLPGLKLQRRASFAPEHSWQDVSANVVETDAVARVTVEAAGTGGFFRLLAP